MIKLKAGARFAVIVIVAAFMLTLFPVVQVAAADEIRLDVNYDLELLTASGAGSYKSDAKVIYMYSPGVSSTAGGRKQSSEKWYPMYNDQIELKNYIPKSDRDYVIAVRLASDTLDANGTYQSRRTVIIHGRPNISTAEFKTKAVYSSNMSAIVISSDLKNMGYDYKVGECPWILGATDDLYIDPALNSLGGSVTIRQTANKVTESFASNEYKVKIPSAAAMPNIKLNEKTKKIIGIGKNQAWSARGDGSTPFTLMTDRSIDLIDFTVKFTVLDNLQSETITKKGKEVECYVIYFKTLADDKKPESPVQKLYIPKSLFE